MEYNPDLPDPIATKAKQDRNLVFSSPNLMKLPCNGFTFGIEEEYFLADAETLEIVPNTPDSFFDEAARATDGCVKREFLSAQVEVVTRPYANISDMREELVHLRQELARSASEYGLVILASGTHPTAVWRESLQSPKERYTRVMNDLQMIGQRNMLCGMHVHVELPDPERRVEVMCRMISYLPLFLALSTSSPFWQSQPTGLKGYRLAAYDELPRTGLPEYFSSTEEYNAYVEALVRSGVMPDSTHIWWAMRPSNSLATLELRAPDCCTRVEDALALAALYRTLAHYLYFNADRLPKPSIISRAIAVENKWQAQRHGVQGSFATEAGAVPLGEYVAELLDELAEHADELGCETEVSHCLDIVRDGTSADGQLEVYQQSLIEGVSQEAAFKRVLEWIASNTVGSQTCSDSR